MGRFKKQLNKIFSLLIRQESQNFLELARQERKAGNRTLLDVLGGETALINAQADAIAAQIEVLINSYTLLSLMGGLSIESIEFVE